MTVDERRRESLMITREQTVVTEPETKKPAPKQEKHPSHLAGEKKGAMEVHLGIALSGFVSPEEAVTTRQAQSEKDRIDSILELQRNEGNYYVQQAIANYHKRTGVRPQKDEIPPPKARDEQTALAEKKAQPDGKAARPASTPERQKAPQSAVVTDKVAPVKAATPDTPRVAQAQKAPGAHRPYAAPAPESHPKMGIASMFERKASPGANKPGAHKPGAAGHAGAAGASGHGKGSDPLGEWKGKVQARSAAIPPAKLTADAGKSLSAGVQKSAASRDEQAKKLPQDGAKAITPPKPVQGLPAIPDDVSQTTLQQVTEKLGRKYDPHKLPDLANESPQHHIPIIGKDFPRPPAPPVPKKEAPADHKKDPHARKHEEKKETKAKPPEPTEAEKEAEQKKLSRTGATVKDEAPPPVEMPAEKKVDIGRVVARLLAEEDKYSTQIVDESKDEAFRGVSKAVASKFGQTLYKDELGIVDAELHNVADAAGVEKEELNQKLAERRKELADQKQVVETDRSAALEQAHKEADESGQAFMQTLNSVRSAIDHSASERAGMVKGSVDAEKIRVEREQLVASINQKAADGNIGYLTAAKQFKGALDAEANKQIKAYQVAAREDEEEINKGATTLDEKKASWMKYRLTKYWLDEQTAALHKALEVDKVAIDAQLNAFSNDLDTAAEDARVKIRDWAAQRLGYERSSIQVFLDWISDWLNRSKYESQAWAKQRGDENKASLDKDALFLESEVAKLSKMTKEEIGAEASKLSQEEWAIVKFYFESGGDALGVLAARLLARISTQQRPELVKKLDQEVLASNYYPDVNDVAVGRNPNFKDQATIKADNLYKAMKGPGTDEDGVFAALGGLTAIEGRAVELRYNARWGDDGELKSRLDEELNDWATFTTHDIDRANAMLAGEDAKAVAIQLDQAMHGTMLGTGIGTDEDTIFAALRNKSPAEIAAIRKAYREKYGKDLQGQLEGELDDWFVRGSHDVDRVHALLDSDTDSADAIALDQTMHGGTLGLGLGTDRAGIEAIYAQQQAELEQQAAAKGWDSAKLRLEIGKMHARVGQKYKDKYKVDLSDAYEDELSGAELQLITGLEEQNLAKISAARINIEHNSVFYADDKVINKAIQDQYLTELQDKKRDLNLALDEEMEADRKEFEDKKDPQGYYKKWSPEEIRKRRREADKKAEKEAKITGATNFDNLEKEYDKQYAFKVPLFGNPSLGFREDILQDTQLTQHDKAAKLLEQKGYLSDVQETRYAILGAGTDEDVMDRVIKGKNRKEMEDFANDWENDAENKELGLPKDLKKFVLDDYSGREYKDMEVALTYGEEPDNPEDQLAKAKALADFEHDSWSSRHLGIGDLELRVMDDDVVQLEADVKTLQHFAQKKDDKDFDWKKYSEMKGAVDGQMSVVESSISVHRHSVDVISDTAAQVIGAVVTAAIIAVSVFADVVSFGGAAAATPAEGAAIAALWTALGISLAGTALTMASKALIKGTDAYGWEEAGTDAGIGLVDALVSVFTAGLGGKILKGSSLLTGMAERKGLAELVANFVAHAAEGAVQTAPGALLGSAANKQNYKDGDAILNILEGAAGQIVGGAVMAGGMGALHGVFHQSLKDDVLIRARTDPEIQARAMKRYLAKNPTKTEAEFLANLDHLISTQTTHGFNDPKMQENLRARVMEHIVPEQRILFKDVPVRVLPEDEFRAFARSESGNAVTVFHDGKPTVVVKAGTDLSSLGEEGIHLTQATEPANAPKVRKLDESVLQHWDQLDIDTQLDLYKTKLELEIDAHERLGQALEEQKAGAKDPDELAQQIEKNQANLENLRKRQVEVAEITPRDEFEMGTGAKAKPQYLDQPARLFGKDPTIPAPPEVEPKLRPIEEARKEFDSIKQAEAKGPLTEGQQVRLKSLENELKSQHVPQPGEDLAQMEKRILAQRPGESLDQYRQRLATLEAEVERGENVELWMRYHELQSEIPATIKQASEVQAELAKLEKQLAEASDAFWQRRRAMLNPYAKVDADAPQLSQTQMDALRDDIRQTRDQLRALENRYTKQPWKEVSLKDPDQSRQGFRGELEMNSKLKDAANLKPLGTTLDPDKIVTPADVEKNFKAYKGRQGTDGFYSRPNPGSGEKEQLWAGESKASKYKVGAPGEKGELSTTKGGLDQLSDRKLLADLGKSGLSATEKENFAKAIRDGTIRKVYAVTDPTGTHFYEVIDKNSREVVLGDKITSFDQVRSRAEREGK
jgi:hypothetical protein